MPKKAIYLSGGGARGAYQVGALRAICDVLNCKQIPAEILSSVSVGSINAAFVAMYADDFAGGIDKLTELWSSLSCGKIFRAGNLALIKSVLRNVFSMMFHYQVKEGGYLLDTTPLQKLLNSHIDFKKINEHIKNGTLSDFEVASICYDLSASISFFNSTHPKPTWKRIRHLSQLVTITDQHILASSSMPLFFPAVEIDQFHYGDGGVRLTTPLRAAIKLGADHILVIGTRKPSFESVIREGKGISFAKILGDMWNALFLDNLDRDIELIRKVNQAISFISAEKQKEAEWKPIKTLYLYPSADLAELTKGMEGTLPFAIRYWLSIFGSKEQSSDLLSFLLFEADYCKKLIALGYQDAMNQKDDIKDFFNN